MTMTVLKTGSGTPEDPWYPIEVQLTGVDSNTGTLMGVVASALRRNGVSVEEITEFRRQTLSGDYDNALRTMQCWVEVF